MSAPPSFQTVPFRHSRSLCHSRASGNPEARVGSQVPAVLGVEGRRMSAFGGGEKTLDSRLQPAGMTEGGLAGGTEGDRREGRRGPVGGTEGAGVVVGWSPRRTRLSFPRKRESRGMNRAPRAGWWGAPWLPSGVGEKTMDSRLQPAGMTEGDRWEGQRGPTGGTEGAGVVMGHSPRCT